MTTVNEKIANLKTAIVKSPPICSGTYQISPDDSVLAYGMQEDGSAHCEATPEQLDILFEACQKATFGRNQEDVLDETYRKAGQMGAKDFTIRFNLEKSRILKGVYTHLLEGFGETGKRIDAELYKLNVYGKGSFFKAHKDTPRGENMFGSLVIVFPSTHVGGALLLRHDGKEEEFNSAHILSSFDTPTVAYVAFYGGILRFGLVYKYPVNEKTSLSKLKSSLKGADALLVRASEQLGLQTALKAVYSDNDGEIMLDTILLGSIGHEQVEGSIIDMLHQDFDGEILEHDRDDRDTEIADVTWVTQMSKLIDLEATYLAYGNEPSIGYIYGDLALMVYVPEADDSDD
ncbi:hypothetical protein MVEN_02449500 [Mycena venus]|uniref:Prolyl 4-hydroxylase alpha subunit Fe(2+) 2OG dioxygenase domain-containing protein n=1 Tax=Mycena venus TaxID=2733690 RepID=A0A8H7CCH8_9AGAR|nr:hypothetical protein MVEN_02449500 [Mycena venus]